METFKVRNLADPTYNKVSDIQPGRSGYNLYVKVLSKKILINITRIDTTRVVICDFLIGDETGVIKMRLRNEAYVDLIKEGDTIIIRNCKVPVINTHIRLQVDAFGKIEISTSKTITEVNSSHNLSDAIYDNYSSMQYHQGGFQGNYYQPPSNDMDDYGNDDEDDELDER